MNSRDIIKGVNGGRALQALSFQNSQWGLKHGREALLKPPIDSDALITRSSGQSSATQIKCFSCKEESSAFFEAIEENGWNIAGSMEAKFWKISASTNMSAAKTTTREDSNFMEEMVTQTWIAHSIYMPMGSFQVPRNHMCLSDVAMAWVKNIKDSNNAKDFLNRYGSHVSSNRYILGGVFYEQVCASAHTATSRKSLKNGAISNRLFSGTISAPFGTANASGETSTTTSNNKGNSGSSSTHQYEKHIKCIGPTNATTGQEFQKKLDEDSSCWAIIDKESDRAEDLVSVWGILLDSIDKGHCVDVEDQRILLIATKLLCETWITQAQNMPDINQVGMQLDCIEPTRALVQVKDSILKREVEELHNINRRLERLKPTYHRPELSEEPLILQPQLKWGLNPMKDLIDHLRPLADLGLESQYPYSFDQENLVDKVSNLLKPCIWHLNESSLNRQQRELHDSKVQHQKIMTVVKRYGFREDGNYNSANALDNKGLASMIEDLEDEMGNRDSGTWDTETLARQHRLWDMGHVDIILDDQGPSTQPILPYVGTVLVDKPSKRLKGPTDEARHRQILLVDDLRHHLEAFSHTPQSRPRRRRGKAECDKGRSKSWCPFMDLVELLHASDFGTQVAVARFLLQQRLAAPMIAPAKHGHAFLHWADALSFVEVKLLNEQRCYVGLDRRLPRAAFLSCVGDTSEGHNNVSKSPIVASAACKCTFPSRYINNSDPRFTDDARMLPVVEIGIGFVEDRPFVVLHVNGRYNDILDFISSAVDIIIVEVVKPMADLDSFFPYSCQRIRKAQWMFSLKDECDYEDRLLIEGTETYVVREMQELLNEYIETIIGEQESRVGLLELCNSGAAFRKGFQASRPVDSLERTLRVEVDPAMVEQSKALQGIYEIEAKKFFEKLKLTDVSRKTMIGKDIQTYKNRRRELVGESLENPLLRMFYRVLSQKDARTRTVSLLWFQRALSQKMEVSPKGKQYLGMVHLWRELCHIFVSFPKSQGRLPELAAQHLMDGYPMEILDGDASMFCELWVTSILKELQALTRNALGGRDARIFVLSAMGVQSSGKSTLLNLMFGAQLMASAGRCTRGVFIQLVPSSRNEFYDYVLIVDTEGLRSPDFPIGTVHDNRLATFGLLPSDASIFMVSNEDDSGLKEVLPMVLLGFKGSQIAESSGGRIKTKLFFVYRSVDTTDRDKLNQHKEKLKRHLHDAVEEVSNMTANIHAGADQEIASTSTSSAPAGELGKILFDDLRIDSDDKKSDVRCMGNLKKGSKPPEDVPDWEYGKEVLELREYIHRRITEDSSWAPRSIKEWSDNLTRVWACICTADFELNFKSAVQCSAYLELQQVLAKPRRDLADAYMDAFTKLESTLRAQKASSQSQDENDGRNEKDSLNSCYQSLEAYVIDTKNQQREIVEKHLSNKKWSIWKVDELKNWSSFVSSMETKFQMRLKDMVEGILKYEATAWRLEAEMKTNIIKRFQGDGNHKEMDKYTRLKTFNDMFDEILSSAQMKFKPQATNVARWVAEAYTRVSVDKQFTSIMNLPSHTFTMIANNAKHLLFGQRNISKLEDVMGKITLTLDIGLKGCTQYSDALVEGIITSTKTIIEKAKLSKDDQLDGHRFVREILTHRMEEIQKQWDAQHNIAEKLRGAERRLRDFFNGVVNGIGATERLLNELHNLLQEEVPLKRPNIVLVRDVAGRVKGQSWALDWTKLRACLDLHLMALIDKGQSRDFQLLGFVSDGSKHYKEMLRILIGVELEALSKKIRKDYVSNVCKGFQDVERACLRETQGINQKLTAVHFLEVIEEKLGYSLHGDETDLSGYDPLGRYLWKHISSSYRVEDGQEANFLDMDYLFNKDHRRLEQVCKSLVEESEKQDDMHDNPALKHTLVESVIKRLGDASQHVSIRCTAKCCICGSHCMHELGHAISTKKHNCIHQISGLAAVQEKTTRRLWHRSCSDDIANGNVRFEYHEKLHNFADFDKVFPEWDNPVCPTAEAMLSLKLREYIFSKYQDALISLYPHCLPCRVDDMPMVSELDELRKSIENRLSSRNEYEAFYEAFKNNS